MIMYFDSDKNMLYHVKHMIYGTLPAGDPKPITNW